MRLCFGLLGILPGLSLLSSFHVEASELSDSGISIQHPTVLGRRTLTSPPFSYNALSRRDDYSCGPDSEFLVSGYLLCLLAKSL